MSDSENLAVTVLKETEDAMLESLERLKTEREHLEKQVANISSLEDHRRATLSDVKAAITTLTS